MWNSFNLQLLNLPIDALVYSCLWLRYKAPTIVLGTSNGIGDGYARSRNAKNL